MDISGTPCEAILKMTDEQAAEILTTYHNACISGRRNGKVFTALAYDRAIEKAIERLKEPPRPQGEWKLSGYSQSHAYCTNCGEHAFYDENEGYLKSNFCPHCGAKMKTSD